MIRLPRILARATAGLAATTLALPIAGAAQAAAADTTGAVSLSGSGASSVPASYDAASDGYSMYNVTLGTGAQAYWKAGYTGQGVGVALIDTGVTPVEGLNAGNVVYGPDLSLDSQSPSLTQLDSYGHGTHMAGIIAGRDATAASPYSGDPTDFVGMAPGAHVVSVKVGDTYGDTDVTQLIAAIDWVVAHRNDPGMNIRVINLSVGLNPGQSSLVDPLAYAAEQAWEHGIIVVAAAGNDGNPLGNQGSGLQDPAYDPNLLAVGAVDTHGTTSTSDDTVAGFSSSQGPGAIAGRRPDVVAPATHIASLRDPGSWIDFNYASTGAVNDRLMRGSGSSEAAAVTSGAAALIFSQHPTATPDQVKKLLMQNADHLSSADASHQGNGEIDLARVLPQPLPHWAQPRFQATGSGSLEPDRAGNALVDSSGAQLTGQQDIFGAGVSTAALASAEGSVTAWAGGNFNGNTWTGSTPTTDPTLGHTWSGHTWSGGDWAGHTWSSNDWSGHTWSGHTWSGVSWSGVSWSGKTWSGACWSSVVWQ